MARTFYGTLTAQAVAYGVAGGGEFAASETQPASATTTVNVPTSSDDTNFMVFAFLGPAHNSATWPTNGANYTASVDISAISSTVSAAPAARRVTGDGSGNIGGFAPTATTGTGIKTVALSSSGSWPFNTGTTLAASATDGIAVGVRAANSSSMTVGTLTVRVGASTYIVGTDLVAPVGGGGTAATATGSITLGGSAATQALASSVSGGITLGGSATGTGPPVTKATSFELSPAGAAYPTTGSQGDGDNIDAGFNGTGTTMVSSTAVGVPTGGGSFAALFTQPATPAGIWRGYAVSGGTGILNFRFYIYLTALPSSNWEPVQAVQTTGGTVSIGRLRITSTGTLVPLFGSTLGTATTGTIPTNQWVRIEGTFNTGAGTITTEAYSDASATPMTNLSISQSGTFGATTIEQLRVGFPTAGLANMSVYFDGFGISTSARLGPLAGGTAASATGSITLGAPTATARAPASATGSITLGAPTATAQAPASATTGGITLGGTATGAVAGSGSTVAVVRTASGTAPSASTSLTVNFTAPTAGNLLVFAVGIDKASGVANNITGWTLLTSQSGTSTSHAIWYKVATGSETSVTGTWTTASTAGDTGIVVELSGVDTTTPIPAFNTPAYSDTASTTIALDPPAATTAGSMALAFISIDTVSAPPWNITATGWTRDLTAGGSGAPANLAVLHYDSTLTAGQDLAPQTFTSPNSDQMSGSVLIVGAQAGGGGGTAASATGGITLGGSVTAQAAVASATGSITLGSAATAQVSASATGSISLGAPAATARAAVTATGGGITLGGSATARASDSTTGGGISIGGNTPTVQVPASTTGGSITLSAPAATAQVSASATGSISLGAPAATARAAVTATGTVTLGGTATGATLGAATATGSINLGGSVTARAAVVASGSIALGGSVTAQTPASTTTGTVTLGSAASPAKATSTATGVVTLGSAGTGRAPATTTGTVTLGGTAAAGSLAAASATGSITLGSTAAPAKAASTATGNIVLAAGAVVARAAASVTGSVTLGGSSTAGGVSASAAGSVALGGSVTGRASASTLTGVIVIGGTPAQPDIFATTLGGVTFGGPPVVVGTSASVVGVVAIGGSTEPLLIPAMAAGAIELNGLANAISGSPTFTVNWGTLRARSMSSEGLDSRYLSGLIDARGISGRLDARVLTGGTA